MDTTSTYTKHFFLSNESLTFPKVITNIDTKKAFALLKEDFASRKANISKKEYFASKKANTSKKDIDMTRNVVWICPKCGHTHVGATATSSCPICNSDYEKN